MAAHELTCVVHVHSVHSDGTGTVDEIVAAARRAGAQAVLLTDHDSTRGRFQAGWHGGVLLCVGVEVSPGHGNHVLAFGVERPVRHLGRTLRQVVDDIHAAGGLAFAAHPFSRGGWLLGRAGRAAPLGDLRAPIDGIEAWSLATDTLEHLRSPRDLLRLRRDPDAVLDGPPAGNLAAWDRLGARRRLPALAGLDAHQYGVRFGRRVPLRAMSYLRAFRLLRTHVLLDAPPSGDAAADTAALYAALAAGRAFLARDSLADATGFRFGTADGEGPPMGGEAPLRAGTELVARAPQACEMRLLRDGVPVAAVRGAELRHRATRPGVHRVEARLAHAGRPRTWVLTNPIYLR